MIDSNLFFILLIFGTLVTFVVNQFQTQNNIYYAAPKFSIKNTNVTFAAPLVIGKLRDFSIESLGLTLSTICQADAINRKLTDFSIDGTINLALQEYDNVRSSGQGALLKLLSSDLFYVNNGSAVNQIYNIDITGFISVSNFGTSKINSLISNGFSIPTISAGDLARVNPDNQFTGDFPGENRTFFQITNTGFYNSFTATVNVLKHFNWTLVGNLFSDDSYGYRRQQNVLDYQSTNSVPYFACELVFATTLENIRLDNKILNEFCKCVTEKQTINVIVLWMASSTAYFAIKNLRERCSAAKKWTFIVTVDFQTPTNYAEDAVEVFQNSLLIRNNGPWDYKSFLEKCQNSDNPSVKSLFGKIYEGFYTQKYNCTLKNTENENLKTCVEDIKNRNEPCLCDLKEIQNDSYISKFLYTADMMSVYAAGISLLQNNCTFLNSKRVSDRFKDFCALTSFSPIDLSFALRFVNITGYTGPIYFPESNLIREVAPFYLYSAYNNTLQATLVGYLNVTGTEIYNNLISFVDGKVPVSKIVPQDPDLSDWVVDLFFGISIIELIVCIFLLGFFIYNRNHRAIRQGAPLITLFMLIGVFGLALTQLILCFPRSDVTCALVLYIFRISCALIFGGLVLKNYRIYKIFTNRQAIAVNITENRLLVYLGLLVLFYFVIVTVMVAVLDFGSIVRQSTSNKFYRYVQCAIPNTTWSMIMTISLEVSLVILIVASLILAWLTRNVRSEYRESRELVALSAIIFALLIVFTPLNYALGSGTDSSIFRFVLLSEFNAIVIISAVVLLFLPKVFVVYRKKVDEGDRDRRRETFIELD